MTEKRYNLINNIVGWCVLAISAFTMLSTIEPTGPLWDCGEFISCSYKMEVCHPPGSPFFLMFNHLFTLFAPNRLAIPIIVNGISGIESAFAVLFLFWSITLLARKFYLKKLETSSLSQLLVVMGAGVVGAIAYNFTDSFWFSAVEGEVYAFSSFFIGIVFWLMLKWDRRADEPDNLRWFVLITYMMGLSIGVHLLSLLALPVMAYIYYFRKFPKITWQGIIITFFIGMAILGVVNIGVIRWMPLWSSWFELLFVNSFGLPYWSGVIFFYIIFMALLIYGVYWTQKNHKVILNTALICLIGIILGFCSYTMVPIRSLAMPPINYTKPDDIFNLMSYLNREQYGERPTFYGPQFTAQPTGAEEGSMRYAQDYKTGKYVPTTRKIEYKYAPEDNVLFPRMSDNRSDRADAYRSWSGMSKNQKKPTFAQNMRFFINYQIGVMYWRYFAWNFIGKENDEQGHGDIIPSWFMSGNWLSGIKFIDEMRLGSQDKLPYAMRVNKARNKMYFLPFILGLIGLVFHYKKHRRDFFSLLVLFFITGVLLIIYENSPPFEPRERDYTLVASFYVFAMWIGFGVIAIFDYLKDRIKASHVVTALGVFVVCSLCVPVLMGCQEWNDHSRAHRYSSSDFGKNYLYSCANNAVLYTNGDNDTYPLWYSQEVEGVRTDVRVVNLQLLMTDWYEEELSRQANLSTPIKFSIPNDKIYEGTRDYLYIFDNPELKLNKNRYYDLKEIVSFVCSDNPKAKVQLNNGEEANYLPTNKFYIPVDKEKVLKNGTVRKEFANRIVDSLKWELTEKSIYKNTLLQMDIMSQNNWDRPIYWAITSGNETFMGLNNYFQQEGMAYRLVPVLKQPDESEKGEPGRVDEVIMYDNIMNKFKWGNLTDPRVYVDGVTRRHLNNYRNVIATLARRLITVGEKEKAIKAIDKILYVLPESQVPHEINTLQLVQLYYMAGAKAKGTKLGKRMYEIFNEDLEYFYSLKPKFFKSAEEDIRRDLYGLEVIANLAKTEGEKNLADMAQRSLNRFQPRMEGK